VNDQTKKDETDRSEIGAAEARVKVLEEFVDDLADTLAVLLLGHDRAKTKPQRDLLNRARTALAAAQAGEGRK
jgi:hypothetical protein